jgi:hypothetical protein
MRRTNEEWKYFIVMKFRSVRNLGIGYDKFGQPGG